MSSATTNQEITSTTSTTESTSTKLNDITANNTDTDIKQGT